MVHKRDATTNPNDPRLERFRFHKAGMEWSLMSAAGAVSHLLTPEIINAQANQDNAS
jgi:hypothetical protein